ncbi:hypothetical protein TNCV_3369191 [Trichonephila clavipes]|uniref:Transposase n=1 Tax=Trichonephila clavipes TaxID=2585209 RepID=A0A8X6R754_TRICX|nr:hypothetical protein TNCV_3369191 [Trichonephila clavipes]
MSLHTALIVSQLLAKMAVAMLHQPAYSPNLAPVDFILFPRIKRTLKGVRHGTLEGVQPIVTEKVYALVQCQLWKNAAQDGKNDQPVV